MLFVKPFINMRLLTRLTVVTDVVAVTLTRVSTDVINASAVVLTRKDVEGGEERTNICDRFYSNRFEMVPRRVTKRAAVKVASPRVCRMHEMENEQEEEQNQNRDMKERVRERRSELYPRESQFFQSARNWHLSPLLCHSPTQDNKEQ